MANIQDKNGNKLKEKAEKVNDAKEEKVIIDSFKEAILS